MRGNHEMAAVAVQLRQSLRSHRLSLRTQFRIRIPPDAAVRLFENRLQSVGADLQIKKRFPKMGVMLDQHPFVIPAARKLLGDGGKVESRIARAKFAEAETLSPAVQTERIVLDENVLEVNAGDSVVIFADDLHIVAERTGKMSDIRRRYAPGTALRKSSSSC